MRIGGALSKDWVGVTVRSDHPMSVTYANGSVVPSDKEHRSALAGLVTVLPHCVLSPDAHAQGDTLARAVIEGHTHGEIPTRARAAVSTVSLSSRAPGEEGKRGNTVTEGTGSIPTWLTTDGEAPF